VATHLEPESPLQNAVSHRDLQRVRGLLADGADPNVPGPLGHTALHTAAARDEPTIAQTLIDAGALIDATDNAGNTPLLIAVTTPKPAIHAIDVLLAAHADPDAPNEAGATPRSFALARKISALRSRFPAPSSNSDVNVPDIEIITSTPGKLTLSIAGNALTFHGELVLTDGGTDRILRIGSMTQFDDGEPLDPQLQPVILSFLTARRFAHEQ
jgi:ankyrin repeat protein